MGLRTGKDIGSSNKPYIWSLQSTISPPGKTCILHPKKESRRKAGFFGKKLIGLFLRNGQSRPSRW